MPIVPEKFKKNNARSKFDDLPMPARYPRALDFLSLQSHEKLKTIPREMGIGIGNNHPNAKKLIEGSVASRLFQFVSGMGRPVSLKEIQKQFTDLNKMEINSRLSVLVKRKKLFRPMSSFYEVVND